MNNKQSILNRLLIAFINDMHKVEEKALITKQFNDISITDMHNIEAMGYDSSRNMSSVAKDLGITVGTLTTAINNLVKKGYVKRVRSPKDRRVVLISLTSKGQKAYVHHKKFHEKMVEKILTLIEDNEIDILIKSLKSFQEFY